jgi:hypothetical protein
VDFQVYDGIRSKAGTVTSYPRPQEVHGAACIDHHKLIEDAHRLSKGNDILSGQEAHAGIWILPAEANQCGQRDEKAPASQQLDKYGISEDLGTMIAVGQFSNQEHQRL